MRSLVCIRNQDSVPPALIADVLDRTETRWRAVKAWKDPLPDPREISGLIVLGGTMNVDEHERYPFLLDVRNLVADAIDAEVPVLGVCLGGQMIARALGAEVGKAATPEIGFHEVDPLPIVESDPVMSSFDGSFPLFQWHEDAFSLPSGAELLHRSATGGNQSFRVGESCYAVQFHFEVDERVIAGWCDNTDPDQLRDYWGASKDELLTSARGLLPRQQDAGRSAVGAFLDLVAGAGRVLSSRAEGRDQTPVRP